MLQNVFSLYQRVACVAAQEVPRGYPECPSSKTFVVAGVLEFQVVRESGLRYLLLC